MAEQIKKLAAGDSAPILSLENQNGKLVTNSELFTKNTCLLYTSDAADD